MNFDLSQLDKKLKGGKAAPAKAGKFAPRLLAKVIVIEDVVERVWCGDGTTNNRTGFPCRLCRLLAANRHAAVNNLPALPWHAGPSKATSRISEA